MFDAPRGTHARTCLPIFSCSYLYPANHRWFNRCRHSMMVSGGVTSAPQCLVIFAAVTSPPPHTPVCLVNFPGPIAHIRHEAHMRVDASTCVHHMKASGVTMKIPG